MITLRNGAAAFLRNGDNFLLMKRADNRKIAPGVWSGVGGHMEPHEINDPMTACYREIEEETGIARSQIPALDLRYIITRRYQNEIRQSYVYFGETTATQVIQTNEGILHWVPTRELLARVYTQTYAAMLTHYVHREPSDTAVYVGVAGNDHGRLHMTWAKCEDFESAERTSP